MTDGFAYRNWTAGSGRDLEESDDRSSPPTYASDPYGFSNSPGDTREYGRQLSKKDSKGKKDIYDFDFNEDEDDSPIGKKPAATRVSRSGDFRRKSTDERMNEILARSKEQAKANKEKEEAKEKAMEKDDGDEGGDIYNSWKSSWKQLMEGLDPNLSPKLEKDNDSDRNMKYKSKSPSFDHSDSFDVSAADFEVGTLAARKTKEKAEDRQRRSSVALLPSKVNSSPETNLKGRRNSYSPNAMGSIIHGGNKQQQSGGVRFSGAISSIDPNSSIHDSETDNGKDSFLRFGSMNETSATDLLKILKEPSKEYEAPKDLTNLSSESSNLINEKQPDSVKNQVNASEDDLDYSLDDFETNTPKNKSELKEDEEETYTRAPSIDDIKNRWLNADPSSLILSTDSLQPTKTAATSLGASVTSSKADFKKQLSTIEEEPPQEFSTKVSVPVIEDAEQNEVTNLKEPDNRKRTSISQLFGRVDDEQHGGDELDDEKIVKSDNITAVQDSVDRASPVSIAPPPPQNAPSPASLLPAQPIQSVEPKFDNKSNETVTKPPIVEQIPIIKEPQWISEPIYPSGLGHTQQYGAPFSYGEPDRSIVFVRKAEEKNIQSNPLMFRDVIQSLEFENGFRPSIPIVVPTSKDLNREIALTFSKTNPLVPSPSKGLKEDLSKIKEKQKVMLKQRKSLQKMQKTVYAAESPPPPPPLAVESGYENKVVKGPKWSALNRIENGQTRLHKQYEDLYNEIKEMKLQKNSTPTPAVRRSKSLERTDKKKSPSNGRQETKPVSARNEGGTLRDPFASADTVKAIKELWIESVEKEKSIQRRESAVAMKEIVMETFKKVTESHKREIDEKQESNYINIIKSLENTIVQLKSELFEVTSKKGSAIHPAEEEAKNESDRNYQKEITELEKIVAMYEKENKRLLVVVAEKDLEIKGIRANFFDQQEELIRELNHEKNKNASSRGDKDTVYRYNHSASQLRQELEKESLIQYYQEEIERYNQTNKQLEALSNENIEKINQLTIENSNLKVALNRAIDELKSERFQAQLRYGPSTGFDLPEIDSALVNDEVDYANPKKTIDSLVLKMNELKTNYNDTIVSLKAKIAWYNENQLRIEELLEENKKLKEVHQEQSSSLNVSTTSNVASMKHRNPNDIKKIRELEKALREAHETIRKKNPDSVANLLYTNAIASGNAETLKKAEKEIVSLKNEILSVQDMCANKIRSLQQDYEHMKYQYEQTIRELKLALSSMSAPESNVAISLESLRHLSCKNLNEAKEVIRLMDSEYKKEISRLRTFYTKKLESLQHKHSAQIQALNRNHPKPTSTIQVPQQLEPQSSYSSAGHHDDLNESSYTSSNDTEGDSVKDKLELATRELLATAEENGKLKAQILQLQAQLNSPSNNKLSSSCTTEANQLLNENKSLKAKAEMDVINFKTAESRYHTLEEELKRERMKFEELFTKANSLSSDYEEKLRTQAAALLQANSKAEEHRIETIRLLNELHIAQEIARRPPAPEMAQFQAMESHINSLESRLRQRELELERAIEECKASNHLDKMRLKSIYEQELREKDDQLLQFKQELEMLLNELKLHSRP